MKLTDNEDSGILQSIKKQGNRCRTSIASCCSRKSAKLSWYMNGKSRMKFVRRRATVSTIEQVDESHGPGSRSRPRCNLSLFAMDNRGRQLQGWTDGLMGRATDGLMSAA